MNHSLKEMLSYKKNLENENIPFSFFLCPATCYLPVMYSKRYSLCAQNVSLPEVSKNTGSVSASALASLGVKASLVGHYELQESLEVKREKMMEVLEQRMKAFVLLTNSLDEFYYQYTSDVLFNQIQGILKDINPRYYEQIHFIYEPGWLIGGEKTLSVGEVTQIFKELRDKLQESYHFSFPLLYGGGLMKESILAFLEQDGIDGVLVGKYANDVQNVLELWKNVENFTVKNV